MLYDGENIESKVYDPETGLHASTIPDEIGSREEWDEILRQSATFKSLERSEGWQLTMEWLNWQIDNYKTALVSEMDSDKLRRLQEAVKCYQSVINYVGSKSLEGEHLQSMQNQDPLTGLIQGDSNNHE